MLCYVNVPLIHLDSVVSLYMYRCKMLYSNEICFICNVHSYCICMKWYKIDVLQLVDNYVFLQMKSKEYQNSG